MQVSVLFTQMPSGPEPSPPGRHCSMCPIPITALLLPTANSCLEPRLLKTHLCSRLASSMLGIQMAPFWSPFMRAPEPASAQWAVSSISSRGLWCSAYSWTHWPGWAQHLQQNWKVSDAGYTVHPSGSCTLSCWRSESVLPNSFLPPQFPHQSMFIPWPTLPTGASGKLSHWGEARTAQGRCMTRGSPHYPRPFTLHPQHSPSCLLVWHSSPL